MKTRKLLTIALALAVALIAFQFVVKKALDPQDIEKLKRQFTARGQYIGRYAPDFTANCLDGSTFRLSDHLATNVVVINFFTTWCGPCRAEMDELQYFVEKMKDKPVQFIAVDVGEKTGTVEAFVEDVGVTFRVGLDPDNDVAGKYRVRGYPTTVVIAPGGNIISYEVGAIANADVSLVPTVTTWCRMTEMGGEPENMSNYWAHVQDRLPKLVTDKDDDIIVTNRAGRAEREATTPDDGTNPPK